jgi:hypothetical protein
MNIHQFTKQVSSYQDIVHNSEKNTLMLCQYFIAFVTYILGITFHRIGTQLRLDSKSAMLRGGIDRNAYNSHITEQNNHQVSLAAMLTRGIECQ